MTLHARTTVLAGLLAMTALSATAGRADAQVYYASPGTPYYYNVTPYGGYSMYSAPATSYSYYMPATYGNWTTPGNWATPGYAYRSYYTAPYREYAAPYTAWDAGWGVPGYTSPAFNSYNTFRSYRGGFRR
jgi:hypothetical protein